jgi:predicted nucleotidyltransferase
MTRRLAVDLSAEHRRLVLDILRANLPPNTKVWLFGSRATGRARPYSDLDLAIDVDRPMTLDELAILGEAFSESDLPYRVDLVDWHNIDDRWRQTITRERVTLTEAAPRSDPAG